MRPWCSGPAGQLPPTRSARRLSKSRSLRWAGSLAVAGHVPAVRSVTIGQQQVLAFLGRVHLYEGHSPAAVVHGIRTAITAGCRAIVLTNAAGGIRVDMRPGQAVLISDHLNLTGRSPLEGAPPPPGTRAGSPT